MQRTSTAEVCRSTYERAEYFEKDEERSINSIIDLEDDSDFCCAALNQMRNQTNSLTVSLVWQISIKEANLGQIHRHSIADFKWARSIMWFVFSYVSNSGQIHSPSWGPSRQVSWCGTVPLRPREAWPGPAGCIIFSTVQQECCAGRLKHALFAHCQCSTRALSTSVRSVIFAQCVCTSGNVICS